MLFLEHLNDTSLLSSYITITLLPQIFNCPIRHIPFLNTGYSKKLLEVLMATNSPETDSGIETKLSAEEKKFYNEVKPETGYDRSIFMVGTTGAGKSAFCNFLANEEVFEDGGGFMSVSQGGACCRFQFNSEDVLIIDSPGFCDSIRKDSEIFNELCKVGVIAEDGTDAVAVVVNGIERFSDNHRKAFTMMEQMGGSFWEHAFIVFTNEREALRRNKVQTPEEYIDKVSKDKKCPPILREMLLKTENRYIFVDSIGCFQNEEYRNVKCHQIFQFINKIREINNNTPYNNTIMLQGKKLFEERQEADKKLKELEETLKRRDKEMEDERARVKKEEERRTQEAEETRGIRLKELGETLQLRDKGKMFKWHVQEEMRTREAEETRDMELLKIKEIERLKREQARLIMENIIEKKTEEIEMLRKELHNREMCIMRLKLEMLENEKETKKESRMEMEQQLRDSKHREKLERERSVTEQVRESRATEYKHNVAKEAKKFDNWTDWLKRYDW